MFHAREDLGGGSSMVHQGCRSVCSQVPHTEAAGHDVIQSSYNPRRSYDFTRGKTRAPRGHEMRSKNHTAGICGAGVSADPSAPTRALRFSPSGIRELRNPLLCC